MQADVNRQAERQKRGTVMVPRTVDANEPALAVGGASAPVAGAVGTEPLEEVCDLHGDPLAGLVWGACCILPPEVFALYML